METQDASGESECENHASQIERSDRKQKPALSLDAIILGRLKKKTVLLWLAHCLAMSPKVIPMRAMRMLHKF